MLVSLVHHWFLPHETNNHRPKAIHLDSLLYYVLLFVIFNLSLRVLHTEAPSVLGYATDIHVEQLLSSVNVKRSEVGLTTLILNEQLSRAAALKAQDMFAKGYWAHNSPDGKTPWEFILSSGYKYSVAGENLAKNFSTSQGVVDAWMASPSHRDNILKSSYRDMGFAVVNGVLNGEETTLVVQMFGATPYKETAQAVPKKAAEKPVEAPKRESVSGLQKAGSQKPVVIPTLAAEVAAELKSTSSQQVASVFASVSRKPLIDIPTLTRNVAFIFVGFIIGVLAVDAWLVAKRRTVRLTGHNIAHILFLAALFVIMNLSSRGALL